MGQRTDKRCSLGCLAARPGGPGYGLPCEPRPGTREGGRRRGEGERRPPREPYGRTPSCARRRAGGQGAAEGPEWGTGERGERGRVAGRVDRAGCGWGRAGRLGSARGAEVGEHRGHGDRVLDGGDDGQAVATARAGQAVEVDHAAHQCRPGPGARGAVGAVRGGVDLVRGRGGRGAAGADDLPAPRASGPDTA